MAVFFGAFFGAIAGCLALGIIAVMLGGGNK